MLSLSLCSSCVYNHTDNIQELGNYYYYLGDGNESKILLNLKPDNEHRTGRIIVPQNVVQYNFDKNYIIAKNIDRNSSGELYWIIEKSKSDNSIHSLDSLGFLQLKKDLNISLTLESIGITNIIK
jgi:hypothetical protein